MVVVLRWILVSAAATAAPPPSFEFCGCHARSGSACALCDLGVECSVLLFVLDVRLVSFPPVFSQLVSV